MKSTATTLWRAGEPPSRSAVRASNEASANVETAAVAADELIAEISRQLTNRVVQAVSEARPPTADRGLATPRRRSATWSS